MLIREMIQKIALCLLIAGLCACVKPEVDADDEGAKQTKDLSKAANINVQLGLGYLAQDDLPRAKKKLFYALSLTPNMPGVVGAVAYYFEKTGQAAKAEQYYLKALNLSKSRGAELNNYGAFLCREQRYVEADRYFLLATKDVRYLNTAGAYENAGICALARKDRTLAATYFSKALENDPRRELSVLELMKLYNQQRQYAKTLEVMDKYELVASLQSEPIYLSYLAAKGLGRTQAAKGYAWILKKRFPHTEQYQQLVEGSSNYDEQSNRVG